MGHLTVKELRKALEGVSDDTPVCDVGHFGETLRIWVGGMTTATLDDDNTRWRDGKKW